MANSTQKRDERVRQNEALQLARRLGTDALTPAQLRVLVAVLALCQKTRRGTTWRAVQKRLGMKSPNGLNTMMGKLRQYGLLNHEKDVSGAILPLYRLEVFQDATGA